MHLEDPLNSKELEVTDLATARFALKTANDYYFAVIHMREEMNRELARSRGENTNQKVEIIKSLLPDEFVNSHRFYESLLRVNPMIYYSEIEDPPEWLMPAFEYLDEQLEAEKRRAEAELAENSAPLNEIRAELEEKVRAWFKNQAEAGAKWIYNDRMQIGGTIVVYNGGNVAFVYLEMGYGDD